MLNPTLTPEKFVAKWRNATLSERATYQAHFIDLCHLIGILTPDGSGTDEHGRIFQFEYGVKKEDTQAQGFADVYYEGCFAIEYKAPDKYKTLDEAYNQLKQYRQNLNNPPLLIVTDINRWEVHTNFNNAAHKTYTFTHEEIAQQSANVLTGERSSRPLDILRKIFTDPNGLHPNRTAEQVTKEAAASFRVITDNMRKNMGDEVAPERIAHFLTKIVFTLFAEDVGLLPVTTSGRGLFTEIIDETYTNTENFKYDLHELFEGMAEGKRALRHDIRYFNGRLFEDIEVEDLSFEALTALRNAAQLDWASVEPSIFGTLFERSLDPAKRSQLGAHYTSPDDINLIIEPVLMQPLRDQWQSLRTDAELARQQYNSAKSRKDETKARDTLEAIRAKMLERLRTITVLDPACGSGNFLYMSLRALLDLEKAVITDPLFDGVGLSQAMPEVHPKQMYGIELNPIAHDLATIVVWIGWIQWKLNNGYTNYPEPVLKDLGDNILRMDAILTFDDDGKPLEPAWPTVDVIVGNPPFLGGKRMLGELGEEYTLTVRQVYEGRITPFSDLVTYWFERARKQIEEGNTKRAGLLATNSIGMGANLPVMKRIVETGSIFLAYPDEPWTLDGAAVQVAMIGFDNGTEKNKTLNQTVRVREGHIFRIEKIISEPVKEIFANLDAHIDITQAVKLEENENIGFIGVQKSGPFDIDKATADKMINTPNAANVSNSDVVRLLYNGSDLVRRPRNKYIIDFGVEISESDAAQYELPFEHIKTHVIPARTAKHFKNYPYWLLWNTRPAMREALKGQKRYLATPTVAKHRLFVWLDQSITPDKQLVAIAREDDYFFGVLHSKLHEVWSLRMGTWLGKGNDPRYTPTTTFETFPFPWAPNHEDTTSPAYQRISAAAKQLHTERDAWLNPPESAVKAKGIGMGINLKDRTLTNLYNALAVYRGKDKMKTKPDAADFAPRLDELHRELDEAVCDAYGWPYTVLNDDEDILRRLLALNLSRT